MIVSDRPHYRRHLEPVDALLGDLDVALLGGYPDLRPAQRAGFRWLIRMEHGIGQSYSNLNPHYPGGAEHQAVGLFLVPNEHSADRWRRAYPRASVAVVGSPRLDTLPHRQPGWPQGAVVALAWHWDATIAPEARSALPWYEPALRDLADRFRVIGHGHPRRSDLGRIYERLGIRYEPDFDAVCREADVLVADNTSALYEFASTGRPVVVLDAPWYRREAAHGLRFWDAADVGVRVDSPAALIPAIDRALELRGGDLERREEALSVVYAYREGAAQRSADVIRAWAA